MTVALGAGSRPRPIRSEELIDLGRPLVAATLAATARSFASREVELHPELGWLLHRGPWGGQRRVHQRRRAALPLPGPSGLDGLAVVEMRYLQALRVGLVRGAVVREVVADLDELEERHPTLLDGNDEGMFRFRRALLGVLIEQQPTARIRGVMRFQSVPLWEHMVLGRADLLDLADGSNIVHATGELLERGLPIWLCQILVSQLPFGPDVLAALVFMTADRSEIAAPDVAV